ncbi:efflux RND transporter periplasmic adaptor subunit [Maribacter sp. R77961]|uniref:efflux RND transporter periplasmic adaptor subunit n=1 Tax=Maribacter sp. R77961 TaxID=3093871 RepID=UPI0037C8F052
MKRTIYTLFIVYTLFLTSCRENKTAIPSVDETLSEDGIISITKEQFNSSGMLLGKLREKAFPVMVQTNGMIDVPPENRAVVSAMMGGYIQQTPLLIGDIVKKGQLLVTVENPEFITLQQNYLEVKQQLIYLKVEYERQQTLKQENITSQKSFLKAESEYKTAKARYTGLKKQLMMLNISPEKVEQGNINTSVGIYAPISGSITQMNVTKGTYVSPASSILEIIDNDHIHIELSVFEKDIMRIRKGQPIQFQIPEASENTFKAEVYLIGTSIGKNRTIKVHGHLQKEQQKFLTGMFVDAAIITENSIARALPSEAIVEQEGKFFVLRNTTTSDSSYTFESLEIQPGNSVDGLTIVTDVSQFSDSDIFLTKGAFDIFGE